MTTPCKQNNKDKGNRGEQFAVQYLSEKGWSILEAPFRSTSGEIDIIAMDADTLVFIEVKYRQTGDYGNPVMAVDRFKQKKIVRTARYYLTHKNPPEFEWCRFDVMGLIRSSNTDLYHVKHIRDAFQLTPGEMLFYY